MFEDAFITWEEIVFAFIFKTILVITIFGDRQQRTSESSTNIELQFERKYSVVFMATAHLILIYQKNIHGDDGKEEPEREEIHSLFSAL